MIGTITAVNRSKSGKAFRVTLNGVVYNAFLDSKLDEAVGKVIDCQITPNKGFGEGIGQWAYSTQIVQPSPANAVVEASRPNNAQVITDRWWLPFCSNQIHALIIAGVIKDKASLNQWAKDLKETVIGVDAL